MTNAEREQLRELAERNYDDVLIGDLQDGIRALMTALDSAEKREKELAEENALNYELRCKHFAALSTERERVIEECAKVAESPELWKKVQIVVDASGTGNLTIAGRKVAAAIRAPRSPEVAPKSVAPEERK